MDLSCASVKVWTLQFAMLFFFSSFLCVCVIAVIITSPLTLQNVQNTFQVMCMKWAIDDTYKKSNLSFSFLSITQIEENKWRWDYQSKVGEKKKKKKVSMISGLLSTPRLWLKARLSKKSKGKAKYSVWPFVTLRLKTPKQTTTKV